MRAGHRGGGEGRIPTVGMRARTRRSRSCSASSYFSPFSFMLEFRARSLLSCLFLFISAVNALHFYLDADEKRCFIEELPTDTVVEGKQPP